MAGENPKLERRKLLLIASKELNPYEPDYWSRQERVVKSLFGLAKNSEYPFLPLLQMEQNLEQIQISKANKTLESRKFVFSALELVGALFDNGFSEKLETRDFNFRFFNKDREGLLATGIMQDTQLWFMNKNKPRDDTQGGLMNFTIFMRSLISDKNGYFSTLILQFSDWQKLPGTKRESFQLILNRYKYDENFIQCMNPRKNAVTGHAQYVVIERRNPSDNTTEQPLYHIFNSSLNNRGNVKLPRNTLFIEVVTNTVLELFNANINTPTN